MARSNATNPKHTEDADPKYLYGTSAEVNHRLGLGTPNTESNFSQIRPSNRSGRSGINDRSGSVVKNGKMGGDLRHSGD